MIMIKIKNLHFLSINGFKWVEDLSEFKVSIWTFIKGYYEKSNEGYFLEVDIQFS